MVDQAVHARMRYLPSNVSLTQPFRTSLEPRQGIGDSSVKLLTTQVLHDPSPPSR
jgi:hypothetical protein